MRPRFEFLAVVKTFRGGRIEDVKLLVFDRKHNIQRVITVEEWDKHIILKSNPKNSQEKRDG